MTRVVRVEELTPAGRGGVSVLRVSGPGALDAIRRLVPRGLTSRGEPVVARLEGASDGLDEAIVCAHSEDCVELHAHGSPALVEELHRALGAAPDESARAAGSVEEYALRCLASAASESGARILLDQAESALQRELQWLRNEPLGSFARGLTDLAARSHAAHFAIEPAIVVLAGPVNAGKSTLFNLLAGTRRATVCDDAGTTRDALCERAFLGRYPVELVDTAGERALEVSDPAAGVERAAQQLASEWSARAQLVLWLVPPRAAPRALVEREGPCLVLASRVDELDPSARPDGGISALADPAAARARVAEGFRLQFELPDEPWQAGRGVVLGAEARARLEQLALIPAHEARERLPELLAACRGIHPRGLPLDSARVVAEPEPVLDGATAPPAAASDSAPRQRSPGKPCAGEYSDRLPGLGDAD